MRKKTVVGVMLPLMLLTACNNNPIQNIQPLTMEEVAGTRLSQMTQDEKEGLIYQYVTDTIKVDTERLLSIDSRDMNNIESFLNNVDDSLRGITSGKIKEEYANYLLLEFSRTPYEWKRKSVDPVGFDPATRLYFVDVTYETTSVYKRVIPNSKIPNGSPDEEHLKKSRYGDYISYLNSKMRGSEEEVIAKLNHFETAWGSLHDIMNEQQGISLYERTLQENQDSGNIGKLTYSGMISDSRFNTGATMTFRYVFKYNLSLGEETDLNLDSLYLMGYKLNGGDNILERLKREDLTGIEVLKPFIDRTIISYHKAVEESNDRGLYTLFYDYAGVDKYYADLRKYTYNNINGYNFEVLQRQGTNVLIKVNRLSKIRAKGTETSMPTYEEVWVYSLVLDEDDRIKINNVNLISSTLVGEPISVIKDVSGVSEMIQYSGESFTTTNKELVEELLREFFQVVYNGDVATTEFTSLIDMGVSDSTLRKISDNIITVRGADKKVNYIVSWNTKTNIFASLTVREIFVFPDHNLDTESTIDFVNRNGEWRISNYTRNVNIKTQRNPDLNIKNAISENSESGSIDYENTDTVTYQEDISGIGETVEDDSKEN